MGYYRDNNNNPYRNEFSVSRGWGLQRNLEYNFYINLGIAKVYNLNKIYPHFEVGIAFSCVFSK